MSVNPVITQPETLEELAGRVADLETRVARLEQGSAAPASAASAPPPQPAFRAAAPQREMNPAAVLGSVGIAGLGIAGAYLLRAISGPGLLPRPAAALVAAAYSIAWLLAASRVSSRNRYAGGIYAGTSMLILAPMLWEMCMRFHATSPLVAAGVLVIYVASAGFILLRAPASQAPFTIAFAGSALTALALSVGTRDMLSFTAILLGMCAWREADRLRGAKLPASWIALLAADASALAMLLIYRLPAVERTEYPALHPSLVLFAPVLLLLLQMAAVAVATIARRQTITVFDVIQACAALTLTGCGLFWLFPQQGPAVLAVVSAVMATACYVSALGPFRRQASPRNQRVFITLGAVLAVLAVGLLLPLPWAGAAVAFGAVAAVAMSTRLRSTVLLAQGSVFISLAGIASGLLTYIAACLAGTGAPRLELAALAACVAALVSYALCAHRRDDAETHAVMHFLLALWAAAAVCGLLAHGLLRTAALLLTPEAHHIALLRTIALCAVALVLSILGSRLTRREMVRLGYVLVAAAVAKLFFEDLRHGHLAFVAASIFIVAVTLIAVPRMAARASRPSQL